VYKHQFYQIVESKNRFVSVNRIKLFFPESECCGL